MSLDSRRDAAQIILGKVVCFAHQPDGPYYRCTLIHEDGMVEIAGFSGHYAPELFLLGPASAVAVGENNQV